jgi:hypothetical protein
VPDFLTRCSSARGIQVPGIDRLRSCGHSVLLGPAAVNALITVDTQVLHSFRWPAADEYIKLPVVPAPAPDDDAMDIGEEEVAGNAQLMRHQCNVPVWQ